MTAREKLNNTLNFKNCTNEGGAILETFHPWDLTVNRFIDDGMPKEYFTHDVINSSNDSDYGEITQYFDVRMAESVANFERYFGFDSMRRMFLQLPFNYYLEHEERPLVVNIEDWEKIKQEADTTIKKHYSDENIKSVFEKYRAPHKNGDFSIRFAVGGFFWVPRWLMGIEQHMLALYDEPELLHDIISYLCEYYIKYLDKIFDYIVPDVLYIMEDLSGANGPMISPSHFDEYIGSYYKKLIPFLKQKGVGHIFVDTDGDFNALIPNFVDSGVEGFLPMDVNAGMDIVKTRQEYPNLKFIGAFNKLEIAKGKEAIDNEFERILPVIKQGGYIPGSDHQVAPSTNIDDYKYYISKLREIMKLAGEDR